MEIKRSSAFHMWNYATVIFLVTFVSFVSFVVPITDLASRASIQVTLLLTAVSFKQLISDRVPVKAYLTRLEKYVLFSFVVLCVPVLEQVVLLRLFCDHDDTENISISATGNNTPHGQ